MISSSLAKQVNQLLFGGNSLSVPGYWYLGLSTFEIDSDGRVIEPDHVSTGYSRVRIANTTDNFETGVYSNPTTNKIVYSQNKNKIAISSITKGSAVTVKAVFICSTQTGTNADFWINLTNPVTIQVGSTMYINAGSLRFTLGSL